MNDESVLGSGIGDSTVNRDSRRERSASESEAENPQQFQKKFRKLTLKSSREMIGLMEVLTEQAAKSRGYLQKLSDFKQELSEIRIQVTSPLSLVLSSIAYFPTPRFLCCLSWRATCPRTRSGS
jgi:hypothetical protein